MRNIANVVRLDLSMLGVYKKSYILLLLLPLFFTVVFKEVTYALFMAVFMGIMVISYPFSIAEKYHIDRLLSAAPLSRRQIVASRYLSIFLFVCIFLVIILLEVLLVFFFIDQPFQIGIMIPVMIIGLALILFCAAVQMPVFYKVGAIRARYIAILPIILLYLILFIVSKISSGNFFTEEGLNHLAEQIMANIWQFTAVVFAICVLFYLLSYGLSVAIMRKKEIM